MEIELTDLEEDILIVAHRNPDMTNEEIADKLDCSASWVTETRNKYESKILDSEIPDTLNGNYTGGGGSLLGGLFYLFIKLPVKLAFWMLEVSVRSAFWVFNISVRFAFWAFELPFRILGAIFGSEND